MNPNKATKQSSNRVARGRIFRSGRILPLIAWLLCYWATSSHAGYVYPFRIISGNTTGEVDETQFSVSDITLSITNLPGGGRRALIGIIGGGGIGGSNNTILVAGNGLEFTDEGGGTNLLAIDPSIVATNPVAGTGGGITNVLDTAGGPYDLVGHTNQPTLLIKGLTNESPAVLTITDRGTMLGFLVATQGGFGSTNAWTTNGLPWTVSDTFGFSNASSVVGLLFTNLGGVPTIYLVPDSTIARTGQSQTWSAPQTFNNSATLTLGAPTWFKSSIIVSDNVTVVSNETVGGSLTVGANATITGNMNAGSFTGSMNGANITGNQSVGTNTLAAFGSNTGTIGSAGQFLVVHLNSAGIPDGWSTVTGNSLATSTNSISAVQLAGAWNNGVVGWIATNFSVATINGTTVTVGFASSPFENITILNGTTNFTLHGSSLTISNLLSAYGVTLTNRGSGQIDLGGTMTMLSNSAGAFNQITGSSANSTQNWSGTSRTVVTIPNNGQALKFIPNGSENGINSEMDVVPQDGSNAAYLEFTRDGPKAGAMFITFVDSISGSVQFGHEPSGNANGDKRCAFISTSSAVGGLIVASQDNNSTGLGGYQFYENDPRFPRILFTNGKQTTDTNTTAAHETYASYGNWTNSGGSATLNGGGLIVIGSNEYWLAIGRAVGSVTGTKDKEYPTNRFSGFFFPPITSAQSNKTYLAVRDASNGLWLIGVGSNGAHALFQTNDLSTPVALQFVTNLLTVVTDTYTNSVRGEVSVMVNLTSVSGNPAVGWMFEFSTNSTGTIVTNTMDYVSEPAIALTESKVMRGVMDAGYALCISNLSSGGATLTINTESGAPANAPNRITFY
jgi:hypothetical protein